MSDPYAGIAVEADPYAGIAAEVREKPRTRDIFSASASGDAFPDYSKISPREADLALVKGEAAFRRKTAGFSKSKLADARRRFDTNPHIQKLRERATQPSSTVGAISTLGAQGISLGLSDEAAGVGGFLGNAFTGQNPVEGYTSARDTERAKIAAARKYAPVLGTAAEFVGAGGSVRGGAGAGASLGTFAKEGAKISGTAGFGYGEGLSSIPNALLSAGLGAGVGAGIGLAQQVAPSVGGALRNMFRGTRAPKQEPIAAVAGRLGIRPTPATVGGFPSQVVQTGLGSTPGGSSVIAGAVERETAGLERAARTVAEQMGPVTTPQAAGGALARGAKVYRRATSAAGRKLYAARDAMMGGQKAPVTMASSAQEIQQFARDYPNTPILADIMENPTVRRIGEAIPDGNPQVTVKEATDMLSHVRGALRNAYKRNVVTDATSARIAQFEKAIEADVMRAAQAADAIAGRSGANSAAGLQQRADALWAQRSRTLQGPLKKAAQSASDEMAVSGESVFRDMLGKMQREGGNLASFTRAWKSLPTSSRREFSATAFNELGRARSGAQNELGNEWSFNTFLTNYDKLSPEARRIAFGGQQASQQIDDIARYAGALRQTDRLRNFSNTARTYMTGAYLATIGGQLLSGDYGGAAKTAAAYPAVALGSRAFLATPAMRTWTANVMRNMVGAGTPEAEKALRQLTARLPAIAAKDVVNGNEIMSIYRAINDNMMQTQVPLRAAAGEEQENE